MNLILIFIHKNIKMTSQEKLVYQKTYYYAHKEEISKRMKKYYIKNKEYIIKKTSEYNINNREYTLRKKREYYQRNKPDLKIISRINYNKRRDEISEYHKEKYFMNKFGDVMSEFVNMLNEY